MKLLFLIAMLPYLVAAAIVDLDFVRSLQTEVDKGKPIEKLFKDFKTAFGRKYEANEEAIRMKIFETNVKSIREHNLRYARNQTTFLLGVNQFSDLTHKEYLALYTTKIGSRDTRTNNGSTFLAPSNILVPDSVDWRKEGYVTGVKDQGQCGSCWAFSSTGVLEGQTFKKTKKLISLSEQQLVDCSRSYGNYGCNGGYNEKAFGYIKDYGIEGEADYPYTGKDGSCQFQQQKVRATVTGYVNIKQGSEAELQKAVATVGPIAVSIDHSNPSFQSYNQGIYYEPNCSSTNLDHAVLVVGYGSESNNDYWLVKNSWGTSWGEDGYIRMARNKDNNCGIATESVYPTV